MIKTEVAMKRLTFAFVLAVLAAGIAFGQELPPQPKFSMWNRGNFYFNFHDMTTGVGPDWMGGDQGVYNYLNFSWNWKDVGWTMTMQWDGDDWLKAPNLRDYSAAFALFKGKLRLDMGKVWHDGYRFANFDATGFSTRVANGTTGILARIYPLPGLSIGAFLPVDVASTAFSATFADLNLGAELMLGDRTVIRASYRMEEIADAKDATLKNKELAVGVGLINRLDYQLFVGYRYADAANEHDLLLDGYYKFPAFILRAFGDVNYRNGTILFGVKLNGEYEFLGIPLFAGATAAYHLGDYFNWYVNELSTTAYLRYDFGGGSSVQIGSDLIFRTSPMIIRLNAAYTIAF